MKSAASALRRKYPSGHPGRRVAVAVSFLAAATLASLSIFATGPTAAPDVTAEKSWPVSVVAVRPESLSPTFRGYGRVESSHVAKIRTDLIAEVAEVLVKEGDWVEQGQILIRLADAESRLRVAERRAELEGHRATLSSITTQHDQARNSTKHYESMQQIAERKLSRHEQLMADGLISRTLLDEIMAQANSASIQHQSHLRELADFPNRIAAQKAAVARAEALLARAELDLSKARVEAPFTGPVLGVFVAPGDRSSLGMPLAEVADASGFEVRVQVPDNYAGRFARLSGQHAGVITARTADGLIMPLSRLSSRVRAGQSGLDAFFQVAVMPGAPLPAIGRVVDVAVTLPEERNVVALPVQSIYENDRVYRVDDNRLDAIAVERVGELLMPDGELRVLVRSPRLDDGARIVTTQLPQAISGMLVEPA
ncbi:MAG: biotin/lipoyl-binding protein [Gammaproteobacteria bacterium]|nr:MAG: biotin/lipoyl-binding protein [Gammaproteobacteria bacterium]